MINAKSATCAMAVMAKAPQPGRCKTRLVPSVTMEQSALLSAAFLRDITENIKAAGRITPIYGCIAYAPLGLERLFDGHLAVGTGMVLADGSPTMPPRVEGFGKCLLHAVQSLLAEGFGAACVVNSDSPTLPTSVLTQTARLLAEPGDRAVLGPADDGGYYLLGVKTAHAHLFEDIAWSTNAVAAQTAMRAREIGLELVTLPAWYDVDDAEALDRLIYELESGENAQNPIHSTQITENQLLQPFPAPATKACIDALSLFTCVPARASA